MTICKRALLLLLCLVCLMAWPVAAIAEENETDSMSVFSKIYSLNMTETEGSITTSPNALAFWEYPLLRAGETFNVEGTMIVRNDSQITASMVMEAVDLPYGDQAKLTYLDNVWLTVKEGETVLFDNTYAHINDADGGLALIYNDMAPGEEHVYTISMKCLFTYPGDVYADATPLSWRFSAKAQTVTMEQSQGLPAWLMITVITFAVVIVALIVIMIVRGVMNSKAKKAKKSIDNPDEV